MHIIRIKRQHWTETKMATAHCFPTFPGFHSNSFMRQHVCVSLVVLLYALWRCLYANCQGLFQELIWQEMEANLTEEEELRNVGTDQRKTVLSLLEL